MLVLRHGVVCLFLTSKTKNKGQAKLSNNARWLEEQNENGKKERKDHFRKRNGHETGGECVARAKARRN